MKNKWWILAILLIFVLFVFLYFLNNKDDNSNENLSLVDNNNENDITDFNTTNSITDDDYNNINSNNYTVISENATSDTNNKESMISSFSTKVYDKSSSRQTNISITCSTLNDFVVKNGDTFSFCNTVRKSYF